MDKAQREQRAAQIRAERERRGLSQAALAELAEVAPNTVSAIENARGVQVGSMGKVMNALQIEPISESLARMDEPQDIHLAVDLVRMWLEDVPAGEERHREVYRLVRFLGGNES